MSMRTVGLCLLGFGTMLSVASATSVSASAPTTSSSEQAAAAADLEDVVPMSGGTCSEGYYTCPDDGLTYPYYNAPSCADLCFGIGTKAQMSTVCNSNCDAACYPSTWTACVFAP